MARRQRVQLNDEAPSVAFMVRSGAREHEKTLLTADGINAMLNEDGSLVIELYTDSKRIGLRISPEDARSQVHVFRGWSNLR